MDLSPRQKSTRHPFLHELVMREVRLGVEAQGQRTWMDWRGSFKGTCWASIYYLCICLASTIYNVDIYILISIILSWYANICLYIQCILWYVYEHKANLWRKPCDILHKPSRDGEVSGIKELRPSGIQTWLASNSLLVDSLTSSKHLTSGI